METNFSGRNKQHLYRFKLMGKHIKGTKVLDIGCAYIPNIYLNNVDGMDARPLEDTDTNYKHFILHNVNSKFPIKDNTYDTILAGEIIEHLNSPYHFLVECRRILKPQGRLIMTTPNITNFFNVHVNIKKYKEPANVRKYDDHLIELSPLALKRLVLIIGYDVIVHQGISIPVPIISRIEQLRGFFKTKNLWLSASQLMVCEKKW